MKKLLLLILFFTVNCFSQVTNEGKPQSWKKLDNTQNIQPNTLPGFDLKAIQEEDIINDALNDKPWRFGYMHSVDFGFEQGQWDTLDNGDRIWRILISSPEALSLNVIFDDFFVPEGSTVYLYNNERSDLLGAYTSTQNQESGILGTWLVKGNSLWIEYYEPATVSGQGRLHIAKATHGYRNAETYNLARGLNNSGFCNLDVDCPIGPDWQAFKDNNKKSVGMLLTGSSICTGALVNNTTNDGTPYFLTANHCYSNPDAWSFRFGWISPNPVCASEENSTDSPTNMTISGATLRAKNAASDFCLVEINSAIPNEWGSVWAGWDKTDNFPLFQVGIHHPSADIMKVCRDDDPATKEVNDGIDTWEITGGSNGGWELGVTEGGSSGSPLFDQDGRIIGQLSGGTATCSGTNDNGDYNYYGRFGMSWDGLSASTRLRDWLDPSGIDPDILDSFPPLATYVLDGAVSISILGINCANTEVEPTITLTNFGAGDITSATIEWNLDGGANTTINFDGNLAQYETETFNIGTLNLSVGVHEINASLTSVNGGTDENIDNDTISESIDVYNIDTYDTTQVHLELLTDDYAQETSWEFRSLDGTILYSFGPYEEDTDDNTIFNYSFDVAYNECYFFEIFDTYGDGICCGFGNGYYSLTADDNSVIASGGEFEFNELTEEIGIGEPLGVNDILAQNLILYPNPTQGILNVTIKNGNGNFNYFIVNILGQEVKNGSLNNGMNIITVTDFISGLYFIRVKDNTTNKSVVTKLIVE